MTNSNKSAEYALRKILATADIEWMLSYPWAFEDGRWHELVFSILARTNQLPESDIRSAIEEMALAGLLQVDELATMTNAGGELDSSSPVFRDILEKLSEYGIERSNIERFMVASSELSRWLRDKYGGRIQNYLRQVGEQMLADFEKENVFTALSTGESLDAMTYWLQNVLGMPLSLVDDNLRRFAELHELSPSHLIRAADRMGLNLAFMDDLVELYFLRQGLSLSEAEASEAALVTS